MMRRMLAEALLGFAMASGAILAFVVAVSIGALLA